MNILREIFGPSQAEIWSQLGEEIGGKYQNDGFFTAGKVVLSHRQWEITLDTYTVSTGKIMYTLTRMRAPYVNKDNFRFNIYRENVFSWLGKILGFQDIKIGDSRFDDEFVIQASSERVVRHLLANRRIRELIQKQPDLHFQVKDDDGWFWQTFPEGVDELYFEVLGVIKDKDQLKELFSLFSLVLNELCAIGSAYDSAPSVKL